MRKKIPLYQPFIPSQTGTAVKEVIDSGWINSGPKVKEFEKRFKDRFRFCNALAVNSGTSALRLAYASIGIGHNDEVISTPWTMEATNTALLEQGAKIVFADINYEDGNLSPKSIESKITNNTKAIVVVHIAGYPCDMNAIWAIGMKYNLPVIEDCAQALGAEYDGHYVGYLSDVACFSFQTVKQITTGDGGMFVTIHDDLARTAKRLRWFGMNKKTRYTRPISELGFKYMMNDISATMGLEGMKYITGVINARKAITRYYRFRLNDITDLKLMEWKPKRVSGNWIFPIHVKRRKKFMEKMGRCGIGTQVMFRRNDWHPIFGGLRKDLPNTAKSDEDVVLIPLYIDLTKEQVDYIVETIKGGW